uniref:Uncharacterized protein n=1 Tax=Oryza glumipatula TaxID=40148 RepID=A0A0D9Z773_9ORYZ
MQLVCHSSTPLPLRQRDICDNFVNLKTSRYVARDSPKEGEEEEVDVLLRTWRMKKAGLADCIVQL